MYVNISQYSSSIKKYVISYYYAYCEYAIWDAVLHNNLTGITLHDKATNTSICMSLKPVLF